MKKPKCKNSSISPYARIGKNVGIGDCTMISENAIIEDGAVIGDWCKIGFQDPVDEKIRTSQNHLYKNYLIGKKKCVIGKGAIIYDGAHIFNKVIIGSGSTVGHHALIRANCRIGSFAVIGFGASVGPFVEIGDGSQVLNYCVVGSTSKIGKYVFIAPGTVLAENKKMLMNDYRTRRGPVIEDYVRIGALCTIISCQIGRFSIIGANSVVTKDVAEETVYTNAFKRRLSKEEKIEFLNSLKYNGCRRE